MNKYFLACILVSFSATTFCVKRNKLQIHQTQLNNPANTFYDLSPQQIQHVCEYGLAFLIHYAFMTGIMYGQQQKSS